MDSIVTFRSGSGGIVVAWIRIRSTGLPRRKSNLIIWPELGDLGKLFYFKLGSAFTHFKFKTLMLFYEELRRKGSRTKINLFFSGQASKRGRGMKRPGH